MRYVIRSNFIIYRGYLTIPCNTSVRIHNFKQLTKEVGRGVARIIKRRFRVKPRNIESSNDDQVRLCVSVCMLSIQLGSDSRARSLSSECTGIDSRIFNMLFSPESVDLFFLQPLGSLCTPLHMQIQNFENGGEGSPSPLVAPRLVKDYIYSI